jgi:aerotaxis receptor
MPSPTPTTTATEHRVADTDLFFSITDAKGIIRSGNRAFERISGYPLGELVGRAHNVVRHPGMPRAAFRVMWETLQAGEPAAAYVCNRAADGGFYWVMATIAPIGDGFL